MLKDLPYDAMLRGVDYLKKKWRTVPWPEGIDSVVVEVADVGLSSQGCKILENNLRRQGFEGMYMSYHYKGQCLDVRRPHGYDAVGKALELHLRGRPVSSSPAEWGERYEIIGHVERSRYEHKREHINTLELRPITAEELRAVIEATPKNIDVVEERMPDDSRSRAFDPNGSEPHLTDGVGWS